MAINLADIDAELERRKASSAQGNNPSLNEIDAELARRGIGQPQPEPSFMDTVGAAAKNIMTVPQKVIPNLTPEKMSGNLPMAGAIAGGALAGPVGTAVGAGLGQIGSRMADLAYGRVQPANAMNPAKEAMGPMVQTAVSGFPETTQGQALKSLIGKGMAKVGSAFSGAKASDLQRAAAKGFSTYSAPSMEEASTGFGNALQRSGINTTPSLESTIDPQLSQARQTALDAGKKLETSSLPIIQAGSKTGDPHALYAYNDKFGPGGSERSIYNVFGDPSHPAIQQRGWGSSVEKADLEKAGIPITGRQPNASTMSAEDALKGRQAIDRIIAGTPQKDKPTLLQLGKIRDQFNQMLSNLSPETASASKDYADAILKSNLTKPMRVNKGGEYSALAPLVAGVAGSTVGVGSHDSGKGALTTGGYLLGTSPLAMGAVATTMGAISPELRRAALASFIDRVVTKKNQ